MSRHLHVPDGLQPEAYFAGLLASALFGITAGTLLFLTGVLFGRTSGKVPNPDAFTAAGRIVFHPEHETLFFLAGCALAVGVVVVHALLWNRRLSRRGPAAPAHAGWIGPAAVAVAAGGALAAGLLAFFIGRRYVHQAMPIPAYVPVALLLVVGFCLVAGAAGVPARFTWSPRHFSGGGRLDGADATRRRRRLTAPDVLVPAFLVAVLPVPAWRLVSGRVYTFEQFAHWDYFAMGPTVAFSHGQALGANVHSEYGMGWPMVFGFLKALLSVSYGHMILISSIVTCLYYVGAYLLLRVVTGRPAWAAVGTLLALLLQMFSGPAYATAWQLPSVLVMRRPLDVWVFLAMALHLRTRRRAWAVAAGALTGLAVLLSTDTGVYLAAAYLLYLVCLATMEGSGKLRTVATSAASAVGVLVVGLGFGSHWTMLSTAFWKAWWEPISLGAQGFTALPIVGRFDVWKAGLPDRVPLTFFVGVVVVYLALLCHLVIKLLHRRAVGTDVFLGCVSGYGLLTLITFLGRSDTVELPHLYVPLAVVATVLAGRLHQRYSHVAPSAVAPLVLICALGVAMVANPRFRHYPGPAQTIGSWSRPDGLCLMAQPRDVCGLPASYAAGVRQFRDVTADMRRVAATGRVALLDYQAQYIVAAGIAPMGSYVPVLDNLFTEDQVRAAEARFVKDRPTYVFIWFKAQDPRYITDVGIGFRAILQRSYTLDHTVAQFEVWKLR